MSAEAQPGSHGHWAGSAAQVLLQAATHQARRQGAAAKHLGESVCGWCGSMPEFLLAEQEVACASLFLACKLEEQQSVHAT